MAVPGQHPGASEYSWGEGMFPNPEIDFGKESGFPPLPPGKTYEEVAAGGGSLEDQLRVMAEYKRKNEASEEVEDLTYVAGNPGRFGPQPPLVRTPPVAEKATSDVEPEKHFERKW